MSPDTPITLADAAGPIYWGGPNLTGTYTPAQLRELAAYRRRRAWGAFTTELAREILTDMQPLQERARKWARSANSRLALWRLHLVLAVLTLLAAFGE